MNILETARERLLDTQSESLLDAVRGLLAEWKTTIAADVKVRVVDSTADCRWMVLPIRPAGTDGWSADQLGAIVREGDRVGVTVPSV
jgi:hypothetical protein